MSRYAIFLAPILLSSCALIFESDELGAPELGPDAGELGADADGLGPNNVLGPDDAGGGPSDTNPAPGSCLSGWQAIGDGCYLLIPAPSALGALAAQSLCENVEMGAHLVVVSSEAEYGLLASHFVGEEVWAGARYHGEAGGWTVVSADTLFTAQYCEAAMCMPLAATGPVPDGCLALTYSGPKPGHSMRDCAEGLKAVLCELDSNSTQPGG
jgi:hypothetical protein